MEDKVIIGVNVLENLTMGMYTDRKILFREYIQNSCDSIDMAVENGILADGEGRIEIWIDERNNHVCIEDNAQGIPASEFKKTLFNIGDSSKTIGKDKGFRGIGHWCGIGYCKVLMFISKAKGETVESVMSCDADTIRNMINEHNLHIKQYTIDEVLGSTVHFFSNPDKDINTHYFKVQLLEVSALHLELCSLTKIKDYLSFVAPVQYATEFRFKKQIHDYANQYGYFIQEYSISIGVEGKDNSCEPIYKKYTPSFTTHSKGEDKIYDVDFQTIKDNNSNVIAWLWYGISSFKAQILSENLMRGIRLRTQNIQIGGDDALQKLFREDRGQYYFIGEVFAINKQLVPNARRDYFIENDQLKLFETKLSAFFNEELSTIYKKGSTINSSIDKINKADKLENKLNEKQVKNLPITAEDYNLLSKAQVEKERAEKELEKIEKSNNSRVNSKEFQTKDIVINTILENKKAERILSAQIPKIEIQVPVNDNTKNDSPQNSFFKEKHVPYSRVIKIINECLPRSFAETIINRLTCEFMK